MPLPASFPPRIQIQRVWPLLDCGRYPVKRTVGTAVDVWADIFRDGHEVLEAAVVWWPPGADAPERAPMRHFENDRWTGSFPVTEVGSYRFGIEAWVNRFATWRRELERKAEAGQPDLSGELSEGLALLEDAAADGAGDSKRVTAALKVLRSRKAQEEKVREALAPELLSAAANSVADLVLLDPLLEVNVERERAAFGAWYELFPRSWGGFRGVSRQLPKLAELGFDVLYFPPVHPIGHTNRKGKNNALVAGPEDPGSPWAIGSEEGGHTAVHPDLGTLEDFERLVRRARKLGLEIALDFAIQCSPDHPWLREHPEWFHRRPDGTLKYAENPPKKYQDIYNVNFASEDWQGLWEALRDAVLFWVERGVTVFRVDNPHTKPIPFWEWLIADVRARHPDVVFLSEAFTRPRVMEALAKVGFSQSYTYFTWKNTKSDLVDFMRYLVDSDLPQYYRPNFFANTQDILHAYLQHGGRPAFEARLVLAATLSPTYGIYSGFENCENVPLREGSEEYLDSEKYEVKKRKLDGPLLPLVQRLNAIRRDNPVFRRVDNLTFLETENDQLLAYAKREPDNVVVVCVNLDPHTTQEGVCAVPAALGVPPSFAAAELLTGETFAWRIGRNYLLLAPGGSHIAKIR